MFNEVACDGAHSDSTESNTKSPKEELRVLFGREDLSDFYRTAMNKFFELKMNKLSECQDFEDRKELIICGIWKISVKKDDSAIDHIKVYRLHVVANLWEEMPITSLPQILLLPMGKSDIWRSLLKGILWNDVFPILGYYSFQFLHTFDDPKGKLGRSKVGELIVNSILKKLDAKLMGYAVKTLRKNIYAQVIDREFFKVAMSINFRRLPLSDYLQYANNKPHLIRVYKENRNLIPLIASISADQWHRTDLFSEKLWVKSERVQKEVGIKVLSNLRQVAHIFNQRVEATESGGLGSFDNVSSYRWLMKAPHSVVQSVCLNGSISAYKKQHILILAKATQNLKYKIPVIALRHILQITNNDNYSESNLIKVQRLYHLYLSHVGWLWEDQGYAAAKQYSTDHRNLSEVIDWFNREGCEKYPTKNSTWSSLVRKSNEWHREMISYKVKHNYKWSQPFDEIFIDGISIKPLSSTIALTIEGNEMKHCVAVYHKSCYEDKYRVFTLKDDKQVHSTLGVIIVNGKCTMHQHYGKCNSAVSEKFKKAGSQLIKLLNKKTIESDYVPE